MLVRSGRETGLGSMSSAFRHFSPCSPTVEASDLKSDKCGCESRRGDGDAVQGYEVFVVKKDEGESCLPLGLLLVAEEFVEPSDGGFRDGSHGTGAVEDEGDFCEVFVHSAWHPRRATRSTSVLPEKDSRSFEMPARQTFVRFAASVNVARLC